mgnify:CR=1 FL=1
MPPLVLYVTFIKSQLDVTRDLQWQSLLQLL